MDYNVRTSFDVRLEIELFGVNYHSLMQNVLSTMTF